MSQEQKNIIELSDFKSNLLAPQEYGHDGTKFVCKVKYSVGVNDETEILDAVIFTTYQPILKLNISDNADIITDDKYHLDFNTRFNKFKYDNSTKTLTINGNSSKLGNYKVEISEHI